jgi:hypothetical protein
MFGEAAIVSLLLRRRSGHSSPIGISNNVDSVEYYQNGAGRSYDVSLAWAQSLPTGGFSKRDDATI